MRDDKTKLDAGEINPREEHQAPGGAAVNRAAGVATSAALGGASAGALVGAMAGPVGVVVGAAVGAVAAGLAGNAVLQSIDAKVEDDYWRENFRQQPYVGRDAGYDDYGPAYRYGIDGYVRHQGHSFEDAESALSQAWTEHRGSSSLHWDDARHASRDGWYRVALLVQRSGPSERMDGQP